VAATINRAYIVNHYIVTSPRRRPCAAAVSAADPKSADAKPEDAKSAEAKPADAGNPCRRQAQGQGNLRKGHHEKTAAERPTVVEKPQAEAKGRREIRRCAGPRPRASHRAIRPTGAKR